MRKRRPSKDGMVRKRKHGRREGRIVIGHKENGDSIFRYIHADTQKELTAKLRQNIDIYQGVDLTEECKMMLSEWLDRWLEQMSSVLRPGTQEHYRSDLEHYIKPYLGQNRLTQITADDLRKLYDTLKQRGRVHPRPGQSRGLSTTTVHSIHTTLHHALKSAVDQRLLPYNSADHVAPPKVAHKTMSILNDKQMDIFLSAVDQDPIWKDFFYTELTTGLRLGEICGLMWSDFNERKGALSIRRTLHKEKGGRLVVGDPKTCAGTRTIVLPSSTAELRRRRKKASYSPWIFHNPLQPEAPMNPSTAYHQLKKILTESSLPDIRFHDLRHTFATASLEHSMDVKTLPTIIGHVSSSTTLNIYAHVTDEMQRTAASKIDLVCVSA
ncbi:MAG TPA: site-specific integrase [Candidatus Flavonifractor merdavium]|nr:site-specific integrase [Candidatus Flavonifractor merdavium]